MNEHILQFFSYSHLPANLRDVSRPFGQLAHALVETLPRNPERTVALRKLLEAKDAAVRSRLTIEPTKAMTAMSGFDDTRDRSNKEE